MQGDGAFLAMDGNICGIKVHGFESGVRGPRGCFDSSGLCQQLLAVLEAEALNPVHSHRFHDLDAWKD